MKTVSRVTAAPDGSGCAMDHIQAQQEVCHIGVGRLMGWLTAREGATS